MPFRALPVVLAAVLLLTGCAPAAPQAEPSPTPTPVASAPSPTPTLADPGKIVITVDGIEFVKGGATESALFRDGSQILALLESATGVRPEGTALEDTTGYGFHITRYDWEGLRVSVDEDAGHASVAALAPAIGDVPLTTSDGISVGSSREDAVSAGGFDDWDENQDGIADYLGINSRPVDDAESLTRPGEPGILYILLAMSGDTVEQIQSPANDFSDL
ncbi:hypothetical protein ACH3VR_08720 [Microbacterium sp. B2969]|uniref:Uncharacterized protein n=1 Tax=Microbacterium alkaliflavum TaxID=3248839 RepID=A0ABW7Q6F2_9MICO